MFSFGNTTSYRKFLAKLKKKPPRVPDLTCPIIDDVLDKLEKQIGKELTERKFKALEKKLERLRRSNEALRDSGKYWYEHCKDIVRDFLGKKRY